MSRSVVARPERKGAPPFNFHERPFFLLSALWFLPSCPTHFPCHYHAVSGVVNALFYDYASLGGNQISCLGC